VPAVRVASVAHWRRFRHDSYQGINLARQRYEMPKALADDMLTPAAKANVRFDRLWDA